MVTMLVEIGHDSEERSNPSPESFGKRSVYPAERPGDTSDPWGRFDVGYNLKIY